ncbi:hypothetical protein MPSEU_000511600 [Mayamaea pseudoterrestris]|nr:hypothetical protein MPSEU_000511600 [Mayamaea pseudoterrestris]
MSDSSTSRSSRGPEDSEVLTVATTKSGAVASTPVVQHQHHPAHNQHAAATTPSLTSPAGAKRQSKLKGMLTRGIHGTGGAHGVNQSHAAAASELNAGSTHTHNNHTAVVPNMLLRPRMEKNQESTRLQQDRLAIMKKIEATTSRAARDMDKIRKESLLKENKVRAEIEQLTKDLSLIGADDAKKIKSIQEREANELEKLVQELKRL